MAVGVSAARGLFLIGGPVLGGALLVLADGRDLRRRGRLGVELVAQPLLGQPTGELDPDDALVIRPAFWAPVLDASHDDLLDRIGGRDATWFFRRLSRWATSTDAGSAAAMMALVVSGLIRQLPWARSFHFPTLRWIMVHYVGDAVAYQINASDRTLYDAVHAVIAETLSELAEEAGPDAPLCVIAHSLGTVVASNFFYDLEVEAGCYGAPRAMLGKRTNDRLGASPMAVTLWRWPRSFPPRCVATWSCANTR